MAEHSRIPPSSAHIWGSPNGCPGWVAANATYPETEEGEEAREGTAAHELGESMIKARAIFFREFAVGTPASNGVVITDDIFESAVIYAKDVLEVAAETGVAPMVENRVHAPHIHAESWGTPDTYLVHGNRLVIWDFKHGHEKVEAFENWQAINYFHGIIHELRLSVSEIVDLIVEIRIVQPRAYHRGGVVRVWRTSGFGLEGLGEHLKRGAAEGLSDNPPTRSGPYCKHCPGRHACSVALEGGVALYEASSHWLPAELSPQALGVQLTIVKRARKQLEYLETGYEAQVNSLVRSGTLVPGWSTETKVGKEKWDKPVGEVIQLGDILGHNLKKPPQAITPNAARKLGIDGSVITVYSSKPRVGIIVVPDNGDKAREIFEND